MVELRLIKQTNEYLTLYIRSPIIEELCQKLSHGKTYRNRYDFYMERRHYILDGYSDGKHFKYLSGLYNLSILTIVGLKDGVTVRIYTDDDDEVTFSNISNVIKKFVIDQFLTDGSNDSIKTKVKVCGYTTKENTKLWQQPLANTVSIGSGTVAEGVT